MVNLIIKTKKTVHTFYNSAKRASIGDGETDLWNLYVKL